MPYPDDFNSTLVDIVPPTSNPKFRAKVFLLKAQEQIVELESTMRMAEESGADVAYHDRLEDVRSFIGIGITELDEKMGEE